MTSSASIPQSTVPSEIYSMQTVARGDVIRESDSSDTAAVPSPASAAIALAAASAEHQSVASLMDRLECSLQSAHTSEEMKNLRDLSAAMQQYLRSIGAGLREQNRAAEVKIRAERHLGEALAQLEKAKGGGDQRSDHRLHDATGGRPTLADIGITKTQSSRWQAIAFVPQDDFEKHLAKVKNRGEELTSAGVIRLAKRIAQRVGNSVIAKSANDGDLARDGEQVKTVAEIDKSVAGMAAEDQRRANATIEPSDAAGVDKAKELSETSEPEERDSGGKGTTRVDRPQQGALPSCLQFFPDVDPYDDREPLWLRGALNSSALIASTLSHIPNKERITALILQVIDALAPTLQDAPIPKEKREFIARLLRALCGYRTLADQLLHYWAKADEAITQLQLEDVPD